MPPLQAGTPAVGMAQENVPATGLSQHLNEHFLLLTATVDSP
jgi:hypothetical protein